MSHATTWVRRHGIAHATFDSPLGPVLVARSAVGIAGVWFDGQKHHPGTPGGVEDAADPLLRRAADQLLAYFRGESDRFDLPLDLQGSAFERGVWQALQEIDRGTTQSYGAIACRLGTAGAVRAVGGAIGRNPVSVIVPCHRVVGSDGSLTGYAGGTDRKRTLLTIEGAMPVSAARSTAPAQRRPELQ